jgi:hypothetical protein
MADIFISYAKEDREQAAAVAKALENLGWQVFWDRSIPPGKTWDEVIEAAIEAARCMLVLWSRNAVESKWVRAEAEEGLQREILIPVLIEESKIPLVFRPLQAASLIDWNEEPSHLGFKQLIQAIVELIEAQKLGEKKKATKSDVEVIPESPKKAAVKLEPDEAATDKTKQTGLRVSGPEHGVRKMPPKRYAIKIGVLIASAVVVVAGGIVMLKNVEIMPGPPKKATAKKEPDSHKCELSSVYRYPAGYYRREAGKWIEYHNDRLYASFEQFDMDSDYIYLVDKSRNRMDTSRSPPEVHEFYVRLPVCGGDAQWSYSNPLSWTSMYRVKPADQ